MVQSKTQADKQANSFACCLLCISTVPSALLYPSKGCSSKEESSLFAILLLWSTGRGRLLCVEGRLPLPQEHSRWRGQGAGKTRRDRAGGTWPGNSWEKHSTLTSHSQVTRGPIAGSVLALPASGSRETAESGGESDFTCVQDNSYPGCNQSIAQAVRCLLALSGLAAPAALVRAGNPQETTWSRLLLGQIHLLLRGSFPRLRESYFGVKALSKIEAQVSEEVGLLISEPSGFKQGDLTSLERVPWGCHQMQQSCKLWDCSLNMCTSHTALGIPILDQSFIPSHHWLLPSSPPYMPSLSGW